VPRRCRTSPGHCRPGDAVAQERGGWLTWQAAGCLSLVQWDTLRHLNQQPGASLHELAVLTFQTDQSFGSLAARMADRGLIERVPGPGRAVRHRLTAHGARLRAEGQALVDVVLQASFQELSAAELDQLGKLLDKALRRDPIQSLDDIRPSGRSRRAR
jgi:DNA-binding MarR family transcriptional regulator